MNIDRIRVAITLTEKVKDIIEEEISTTMNEEEALSGHLDAIEKVLINELNKAEKSLMEEVANGSFM